MAEASKQLKSFLEAVETFLPVMQKALVMKEWSTSIDVQTAFHRMTLTDWVALDSIQFSLHDKIDGIDVRRTKGRSSYATIIRELLGQDTVSAKVLATLLYMRVSLGVGGENNQSQNVLQVETAMAFLCSPSSMNAAILATTLL